MSSAAAPSLPPLPAGGGGAATGDTASSASSAAGSGSSAAAGSASSRSASAATATATAASNDDDTGAAAEDADATATGPYYWQVPNREPNPVELVTHNLHWLTWQLLGGVEYVGEVLSEIFSIQNSRFAWATEADRSRVVRSRRRRRPFPAVGPARTRARKHASLTRARLPHRLPHRLSHRLSHRPARPALLRRRSWRPRSAGKSSRRGGNSSGA